MRTSCRDPDTAAGRILYGGNISKMARATGLTRGLLCRRKKKPGETTLEELGLIATYLDLTPEEIGVLVKERRF